MAGTSEPLYSVTSLPLPGPPVFTVLWPHWSLLFLDHSGHFLPLLPGRLLPPLFPLLLHTHLSQRAHHPQCS